MDRLRTCTPDRGILLALSSTAFTVVAALRFTCIASRGGLYGVWSKRVARQVQQAGPYFSRLSTTPLKSYSISLWQALGALGPIDVGKAQKGNAAFVPRCPEPLFCV